VSSLFGANEFYKKQLIAPEVQSPVPETCRRTAVFAILVEDSVRRTKADFPLVPLCPVKSMAPVRDRKILGWKWFIRIRQKSMLVRRYPSPRPVAS
jgi:hypothetical protein